MRRSHTAAPQLDRMYLHHVPLSDPDLDNTIADVEEEARSQSIGFVTAGDPADYQTWEERVEARRTEPDPEKIDTFTATQTEAAR
jgi:hypothetical protein